MLLPKFIALISTVALLFSVGYFTLAALPLLILKHDTPIDSRFIRGVFNTFYTAAISAATIGALSYAIAAQPVVALGMSCVAAFDLALRQLIIPRMDNLRRTMIAGDAAAIRKFRQLHIAGVFLNVVQLGAIAWGMTKLAI